MNLALPLVMAALLLVLSTECFAEGIPSSSFEERKAYIEKHFGEMQFKPEGGFILRKGRILPNLVWDEPEIASALLAETSIPTRWYDADLNEVQRAESVGRYYVYGEAPAPQGYPLCRAMTCYCLDESENLEALARKLYPGQEDRAAEIVKGWMEDEEKLIVLCRKMESDPPYEPERPGQWLMDNATVHVRLKRRIRNLTSPPVVVKARRPKEGSAPILSSGKELTPEDREFKEKMEAAFGKWQENSSSPMSVVIAREGNVIFSRASGEMEGKPVTVNTPMLIHSAMKPIMGLQLAMYFDRGFIDLDEPIGNYLPEFDTPRDQALTFRAAQVHVTGINFPWALAFSRHFYFHTWHEALIAKCPRDWNPGDRYQYGCVGMSLSMRAIETLTGRNYWEAMEEQLFGPLGIEDMYPGGTGFSAEDMARLGVLVANRGKYGSWELFSEETYEAIMPVSLNKYFPNLDQKVTRGIGFTIMKPGFYGHGGGCGTSLLVNPEHEIVFAMTRMEGDEPFNAFRKEAYDLLQEFKGRMDSLE